MASMKILNKQAQDGAGKQFSVWALFLQKENEEVIMPMVLGDEHIPEPMFAEKKELVDLLEASGFVVHDDDTVEILDEIELVAPVLN